MSSYEYRVVHSALTHQPQHCRHPKLQCQWSWTTLSVAGVKLNLHVSKKYFLPLIVSIRPSFSLMQQKYYTSLGISEASSWKSKIRENKFQEENLFYKNYLVYKLQRISIKKFGFLKNLENIYKIIKLFVRTRIKM